MPPFHARRPLGKHAAWRPARKKATAGADYIDELRLVGGAPVRTRTLGTTGYHVSELGFGGWGLGGDQWRGVEDSQAREALREAVDRGITFFDTALAYGNGHSERLMGRVLKDEIHAGRVVVATKNPAAQRYMARGGSYACRGGLSRPAHRGEYGKITQEPWCRGVTAATTACVARRAAQRSGMGGVLPPDRPTQGRRDGPALGHLDQRPRA